MFEVTESNENERTIQLEDQTVKLVREDPYGLWSFKWNTAEPPKVLRGSFTTPSFAFEFLENYLNSLKKKRA